MLVKINLFLCFLILWKLQSLQVTKRNILKISTMFFISLGLICPLVLQVKVLFWEACILNVKWDDLLESLYLNTLIV